jgi:hypothetical protein
MAPHAAQEAGLGDQRRQAGRDRRGQVQVQPVDAVQVGVAVEEARGDDLAVRLDNRGGGPDAPVHVRSDRGDPRAEDGDPPILQQFPGVDVGQDATPDDEVGRHLPAGHGDERSRLVTPGEDRRLAHGISPSSPSA